MLQHLHVNRFTWQGARDKHNLAGIAPDAHPFLVKPVNLQGTNLGEFACFRRLFGFFVFIPNIKFWHLKCFLKSWFFLVYILLCNSLVTNNQKRQT